MGITNGTVIKVKAGQSLLEAIRAAAPEDVESPCGGRGTCGKCKIRVLEGNPGPPSPEERGLLTQQEITSGIRLACRCTPANDITVATIGKKDHTILDGIGLLSQAPDPRYKETGDCGIAVDIGTTTVVAYLVEFSPPVRVTAVESAMNAQRQWGADVISRITFAGEKGENLETLCSAIRGQVDRLIRRLITKKGLAPSSVQEISVVGNTTMLHLFAGIDPSPLGVAPFTPVFVEQRVLPAQSLDLAYPNAILRLLPSVAAYVGADITAGIAAVGIDESNELSLLLDLGTNGEMALGNKERILTCATAAGPAFEGAGISCGTGGVEGAIDTVAVAGGKLSWTSIGDTAPIGLCGSGILDTVSALLTLGIIDESGAMKEPYDKEGYPIAQTQTGGKILFTQKDVRQFQLAKGAVAAGIAVLLEAWDAEASEIAAVYLAGGFGTFLRPSSALGVGLLPPAAEGKIVSAKNSAGRGAVRTLLYAREAERIANIAEHAEYIELSTNHRFQDHFMEQMFFPSYDRERL
jgi:uncharacterized 2Fe-2S/4Fe-4S cluster protein (DUF4445 family)